MIMRVVLFWGLLLALCRVAQASFHVLEPKVLGFTADGQTFVYVERNSQTLREDSEVAAVRLDVKTGQAQGQSYQRTDLENPDPARLAFQQWLKKHPARCLGGPRSPDGQYALRILHKSAPALPARWRKQAYTFGVEQGDNEMGRAWAIFRVLLEQGRSSRQIKKWEVRAEWSLDGSFIPCWSADGQHLALISFRAGHGMRDEGAMDVTLFRLNSEQAWELPPLRL
jgi:hypothetical protein